MFDAIALPQHTDLGPLAGKEVRMYADNDEPGIKYVSAVAERLLQLKPRPIVKRIELPNLPLKGDIVDWLDAHDGAEPEAMVEQLRQLAEEEPQQSQPYAFEWLTFSELIANTDQVEYLIENVVTKTQGGIISGAFKTLKTGVAVDLFISLATGSKFSDYFHVPKALPCGLMSAEIGKAGLRERAYEVARAKGFSDIEGLHFSTGCPNVANLEHLDDLQRFIECKQLAMLGIDPSYLAFCEAGDKASNYIAMGKLLVGLTRLIEKTACTIILINHNRHGRGTLTKYAAPELGEISYAGFAEWARFWLLLGARQ